MSRCFQIKNTGSKLEENIGISQTTELSIVNWAIVMCTFSFFLTRLATERKQEEICWEFYWLPIEAGFHLNECTDATVSACVVG